MCRMSVSTYVPCFMVSMKVFKTTMKTISGSSNWYFIKKETCLFANYWRNSEPRWPMFCTELDLMMGMEGLKHRKTDISNNIFHWFLLCPLAPEKRMWSNSHRSHHGVLPWNNTKATKVGLQHVLPATDAVHHDPSILMNFGCIFDVFDDVISRCLRQWSQNYH